jgi:transposase
MARELLSDDMWDKLRGLLPPERGRNCRPSKDHRKILEAMLWKLRTGAPWRDIPVEFGPWQTIYTRFYRWSRSGLLYSILDELKKEADTEWIMIDSTIVRAHQHAAGAKGGKFSRTWAAPGEAFQPKSIC